MRCSRAAVGRILLSAAMALAVVCVAAGEEDLYGLLGVPRGAATGDIKKAYHKLSLKWHPDKWYSEGGAFEGIEPANVLVDEADEAKATFYKMSRAYEVLTDDTHRRIYDESHGDGGEALKRIRDRYGPSWGHGCQNAAYGCQGANIVRGLAAPHVQPLGTFGSAAACLEACESHPECHAYAHHSISFQAQGSDGSTRPDAGKCEMRQWINQEIVWQPSHEPHVTSGFCPSAARKHTAEKYGRTSLLRLVMRLWQWLMLLPERASQSLQDRPEAWGTAVTLFATAVLLVHLRERRRVAMYQALAEQREAYRQVELARMREEIEHRETAKKLEKQLKRELYEARVLFFFQNSVCF